MSANHQQDDDKLAPLLEHFAERLNLVFSYFFCTLEFEGDDDFTGEPGKNDRTWALQTIQNACLHTTLIALRDLDDFFTLSTGRRDDLKASAFDYPHSLSFITVSERAAISKNIAHSTISGATSRIFRWDVFELATKCVKQSMEFLEWIEDHFGIRFFLTYTAALVCHRKTQAIYDYVAKAVESRKEQKKPKA